MTTADMARAAAPAEAPKAAPAVEAAPAAAFTDEPLTNIRKVIARQMTLSLSSMAQLTHNTSFDCGELQAMRRLFKEQGIARRRIRWIGRY